MNAIKVLGGVACVRVLLVTGAVEHQAVVVRESDTFQIEGLAVGVIRHLKK
jgi:hypothetical protein